MVNATPEFAIYAIVDDLEEVAHVVHNGTPEEAIRIWLNDEQENIDGYRAEKCKPEETLEIANDTGGIDIRSVREWLEGATHSYVLCCADY
jgi:hypothetical protein